MFNKRKRFKNHKKLLLSIALSLVLFIGIGYSAVKDSLLVSSGAQFSPVPILKATSTSDTSAFRSSTYKTKIKTITFEDEISIPNNATASWDIGANQNGDVMSYVIPNTTDSTYYDLHIQSNSQLYANKDMSYWFAGLKAVDSINGLELLDTSPTTNMSNMFTDTGYQSTSFTLDLRNFDTSKVNNMSYMFTRVGYSNTSFTLDVSNFNTSKVTDMGHMFRETGYNSTVLQLDVSNFDTSKVTNMASMFDSTGYKSTIFTLNLGDKFDTSNVINMSKMFYGTGYNSTTLTLDVSNFDTSNVTNMSYMFYDTGFNSTNFTLDVSDFNTSKVTNMSYMFHRTGAENPTFTLDVSNFNTSKVTDMSYMFYTAGYSSTTFTLDVSNFDTRNVTNMSYMFHNAGVRNSTFTLDVSNFDTSNVTNMYGMFSYTGWRNPTFTLDVSGFDTSNVINMSRMFYQTGNPSTKLNTSITIRNPNTTDYSDMFNNVATKSGSKITVNYTSATSSLVDQMIATKSSDSNVVKGYNVEKLITFTIDGVSYTANEGMTWNHWIESEYNIEDFIEQDYVYTKYYTDYVVDENWSSVFANDLITPGATYYLEVFCCFDAGSKVLMADGTTKNIEDVEIGDLVMSLNEDTGQFVKQKVTGTIINKKSTDLVYVNLSDGTRIGMRAYHPLLTTEGWKSLRPNSPDAIRENIEGLTLLEVGDTLVGYDENVTIVSIEQRPEVENYYTYNLSVEGHHNYIVNGIIAHNSGCDQQA